MLAARKRRDDVETALRLFRATVGREYLASAVAETLRREEALETQHAEDLRILADLQAGRDEVYVVTVTLRQTNHDVHRVVATFFSERAAIRWVHEQECPFNQVFYVSRCNGVEVNRVYERFDAGYEVKR